MLVDSSRSSIKARQIAVDIVDQVLDSVDPRKVLMSEVQLDEPLLMVNNHAFDLDAFERIIVLGGGKASYLMGEALAHILGSRIDSGLIVVPRGTVNQRFIGQIEVKEASHPIPDESSVEGASRLLELAREAEENDLVIGLFSGGGSSLMALPWENLTLSDKQTVTELLLKSGANISEINTVRKHLSGFKGGQLAKACYPATVLSLLFSDVAGDKIDVIASGPTVPDPTTFEDAIEVLRRHDLWTRAPPSVAEALLVKQVRSPRPLSLAIHTSRRYSMLSSETTGWPAPRR